MKRRGISFILLFMMLLNVTGVAFASSVAPMGQRIENKHEVNGQEQNPIKITIKETINLQQKLVANPTVSSIGGEWTILSMVRSDVEVPPSYYQKYLQNLEKIVKETNGELHRVKYTEYDRVILALTALGKDVANVGGYNVLTPLADFNAVVKQGLNGPIWALIALDCKDYVIPVDSTVKVQTSRQLLIDYILEHESSGGGWSLASEGSADVDITAMALQALSNYQQQPKVKKATDRALNYLSKVQNDQGGFSSWGTVNSESVSQVIVALTSLGIDPTEDSRFVKGIHNPLTNLLSFYVKGGGFKHTLDGQPDSIATDQGLYALVSYDRFINGKSSLYDIRK